MEALFLFAVVSEVDSARTPCPHSQVREWPRESFSLNSKSAEKHQDSLGNVHTSMPCALICAKVECPDDLGTFSSHLLPSLSGTCAARPSQTVHRPCPWLQWPRWPLLGHRNVLTSLFTISAPRGRRKDWHLSQTLFSSAPSVGEEQILVFNLFHWDLAPDLSTCSPVPIILSSPGNVPTLPFFTWFTPSHLCCNTQSSHTACSMPPVLADVTGPVTSINRNWAGIHVTRRTGGMLFQN